MKRRPYISGLTMILLIAAFFTGCSGTKFQSPSAEDNLYLTPIPQSTLDAFVITPPITSKMQAVLMARRELGTTRLEFTEPPSVVSVDEMDLADANRAAGFPQSSTNDLSGDTNAWLIIFEGDFRIVPPDPMHTYTPEPAGPGCAAVIIITSNGMSSGIGTLDCPTSQ